MVGLAVVQHSCSDSELGSDSDSGKNSFDCFDGSAALNYVSWIYIT